MKNYILLWVCLWCAGQLCAETAVSKSLDINIVGHVLDKNTREHLPYISVVLKGTTIYWAQNEMYMGGDRKKREKVCRSKGCV